MKYVESENNELCFNSKTLSQFYIASNIAKWLLLIKILPKNF